MRYNNTVRLFIMIYGIKTDFLTGNSLQRKRFPDNLPKHEIERIWKIVANRISVKITI
jgi:hypothetical protein